MKTLIVLLACLFSASSSLAAGRFTHWLSQYNPTPSLQARDIFVYLPDGHEKNKVALPVIYMHDGQNLFDPTRAYMGQTWEVEKTLNRLIANKVIPPVIVVAIDNTSERLSEYTPTIDRQYGGGHADSYLQMITQHLIPKVEATFITNGMRALIGSSLGGLVSLYAIHKYPTMFSKVAALSPSLWWDDKEILNILTNSKFFPDRLWIDGGSLEENLPVHMKELEQLLQKKLPKERYKIVIQTGGTHSEKFWAMRFPYVLHYLLRD
tara:strand:- start:20554 stop:21348 length:795 start_codon:yes stop_codon:yes gene_type:complete